MKNKRRIIGILAAVILATIGTVALVGYVQSAKDKAVAQEALVEVYVVDKLVPKGAAAETIKASVSVEQIPARLEQPGAITDLKEVGANVAATDLQPGDQLLAARLVAQGAGGRGGQGQGADLGHVHARAGRGRQPQEGRPRRRLPVVRSVRLRRGRAGLRRGDDAGLDRSRLDGRDDDDGSDDRHGLHGQPRRRTPTRTRRRT